MLCLYLGTALILYRFALPLCGTIGSIAVSALYLTYWQKHEALIDFSGTMYVVVIGLFLVCLLVERQTWSIWTRYAVIALLLWFSMHLYEILIVAPVFFVGLWLTRLVIDEKRRPRLIEVLAMLLPFLLLGVHVLNLSRQHHWYTRNLQKWDEYSFPRLVLVGFLNAMDAQFGHAVAEAWKA